MNICSPCLCEIFQTQLLLSLFSLRKAVRFMPGTTPAKTSHWRPREMAPRGKQFHSSPRPAKVSHNQFINRPSYAQPIMPSKVVVPESSNLHPKHNPSLQRQNSESKKSSISNRLHLMSQTSQDLSLQSNGNAAKKEPCSSLSSTKKRITQRMSEMNIDKNVGNGRGSPSSESSMTSTTSSTMSDVAMPDLQSPKVRSVFVV